MTHIIQTPEICTNSLGYKNLLEILNQLSKPIFNECEIQISDWFDANMCSPFGAILNYARKNRKLKIYLGNSSHGSMTVLRKNKFLLEEFDQRAYNDTYDTTIKYWKGSPDKFKTWAKDYLKKYFIPGRKGLPNMTEGLLIRFRDSLYEIFVNAIQHSETQLGVYTCGQFYPNKNLLMFTITDLGIGFRGRIKRSFDIDLSPINSILWALKGNTVKKKSSGGLGLQLIQEFLKLNNGRLIIVAEDAYVEVDYNTHPSGSYTYNLLSNPFPGSSVTIVIRTDDNKRYSLDAVNSKEDIF